MVPVSRAAVELSDFLGLMTNAGRVVDGEAQKTASRQVNLRCVAVSEMSTRPGLRRVVFDEDGSE